jgi:hypothetical protein
MRLFGLIQRQELQRERCFGLPSWEWDVMRCVLQEAQESTSGLGEVLVSLLYNENLHRLSVTVIEARRLKVRCFTNMYTPPSVHLLAFGYQTLCNFVRKILFSSFLRWLPYPCKGTILFAVPCGYSHGRAIAQAVGGRLHTAQTGVHSQGSPCGICGGHIGNLDRFFSESFLFPLRGWTVGPVCMGVTPGLSC